MAKSIATIPKGKSTLIFFVSIRFSFMEARVMIDDDSSFLVRVTSVKLT